MKNRTVVTVELELPAELVNKLKKEYEQYLKVGIDIPFEHYLQWFFIDAYNRTDIKRWAREQETDEQIAKDLTF
jgi:hypothetical protein